MDNLLVRGGKKLRGTITPSGNKNSALPSICATILTNETVTLRNIPNTKDISKLLESLKLLGAKILWHRDSGTLEINNKDLKLPQSSESFPIGMRGSLLLLGPLVARFKNINFLTTVGGCTLGIRELDPHLEILKALGAEISQSGGMLKVSSGGGLKGGRYWFDYMCVTATENFLMAAVLCKGKSALVNAASEPHVRDLANLLVLMGAKISGIGTSRLEVEGVSRLNGCEFTIGTDHHEAVTFLALGAMTGGDIAVKNCHVSDYDLIIRSFGKLGVEVKSKGSTLAVKGEQKMAIKEPYTKNMVPKIEASPWPYFPVDLLPLMMALSVKCQGEIMFWNKVYEGGLLWVPELAKFGVKLNLCDPHRVIIWGNMPLKPASVDAPDIIRAAIALFMVAAAIKGESLINNAGSIKRAHPNFVENLQSLGADVSWV
ncbi:MAG: UDP-N-acetylglucosamine 1-carboxyvinyltransferase [bacterium]